MAIIMAMGLGTPRRGQDRGLTGSRTQGAFSSIDLS